MKARISEAALAAALKQAREMADTKTMEQHEHAAWPMRDGWEFGMGRWVYTGGGDAGDGDAWDVGTCGVSSNGNLRARAELVQACDAEPLWRIVGEIQKDFPHTPEGLLAARGWSDRTRALLVQHWRAEDGPVAAAPASEAAR